LRFINNEARQVEIRKLQNTLVVVGSGTIIFSLWTLIKFIGTFIILRKETVAGVIADNQAELAGTSDTIIFWVLGFFMTIFMGVVVLLQIYMGRCAIAEGRGRRKSPLYLLLAVLMILGNLMSAITILRSVGAPSEDIYGALSADTSISAFIIDLTSVIIMSEMVYSAIRVRQLTQRGKHAKD